MKFSVKKDHPLFINGYRMYNYPDKFTPVEIYHETRVRINDNLPILPVTMLNGEDKDAQELIKRVNNSINKILSHFRFKVTEERVYATIHNFYIDNTYSGNCQVGQFGYTNYFLTFLDTNPDVKPSDFFNLTSYIPEIKLGIKPLYYFDIKREYQELLNKHFNVYTSVPYLSTNGSNMIRGLIKIYG